MTPAAGVPRYAVLPYGVYSSYEMTSAPPSSSIVDQPRLLPNWYRISSAVGPWSSRRVSTSATRSLPQPTCSVQPAAAHPPITDATVHDVLLYLEFTAG